MHIQGNCVYVLPLRNSSFNLGTWTRILTTETQSVTIETRRPLYYRHCPQKNWDWSSGFIFFIIDIVHPQKKKIKTKGLISIMFHFQKHNCLSFYTIKIYYFWCIFFKNLVNFVVVNSYFYIVNILFRTVIVIKFLRSGHYFEHIN